MRSAQAQPQLNMRCNYEFLTRSSDTVAGKVWQHQGHETHLGEAQLLQPLQLGFCRASVQLARSLSFSRPKCIY